MITKKSNIFLSIVFCIAILFLFIPLNVISVLAETTSSDFTLTNGTKIRVQRNMDNGNRIIYAGYFNVNHIECSLKVRITLDSYNELLSSTPDINLYGFNLALPSSSTDVLKFNFCDLSTFTYCDSLDIAESFNYILFRYGMTSYEYYITFYLPFEFIISYDNSLLSSYNYNGLNSEFLKDSVGHINSTFTDCDSLDVVSTYFYNYWFNSSSLTSSQKIYDFTYSIYVPTYNVSFYDYDGDLIDNQVINEFSCPVVPVLEDRIGYDFIGWNSSVDGVGVLSPITTDVTFTATYKIKTFEVLYKDYNGNIISSQIIDYGNYSIVPNSPSREGYTFLGWQSSVSDYDINSSITQNVSFTATYKINQYNVKFIGVDGVVLSDFNCDYGSYVNVPTAPSIVGYTFNGWKSNNDLTINSAIIKDVTFTATYSINIYVVNFYDENNNLISSVNVEHGNILDSSIVPDTNNPGFTFLGWQSSVDSLTIASQILSNVNFTKTYEIIPEFWEGVEYAKNENYQNGYTDGVSSVDTSVSYTNGYNSGYTDGYNGGYNQGRFDGIEDANQYTFLTLISSAIDAPVTYFRSLFNFEFLGVNLQDFLTALFTLCLIVTIVKLCLGGI